MVIELQREQRNAWRIYRDVGAIVDAIYARKPYTVECRSRDEKDGQLYVKKMTGDVVYQDDDI